MVNNNNLIVFIPEHIHRFQILVLKKVLAFSFLLLVLKKLNTTNPAGHCEIILAERETLRTDKAKT